MDGASNGVAERNVGGGTGMICHDFKGGTGTGSRRVQSGGSAWTVGVLVQANHGGRDRLLVDGVHVGEEIPVEDVPSAWDQADAVSHETGSIIVIVATDAGSSRTSCAGSHSGRAGIGRVGGAGGNSSGDIMLAFSTANAGRIPNYKAPTTTGPTSVDTPRRGDHIALLGDDRGDRGGDPERARRGRHDGRPRGDRARAPPRAARRGHDEVREPTYDRGGGIRTRDLVPQSTCAPYCATPRLLYRDCTSGYPAPHALVVGSRNVVSYALSILPDRDRRVRDPGRAPTPERPASAVRRRRARGDRLPGG